MFYFVEFSNNSGHYYRLCFTLLSLVITAAISIDCFTLSSLVITAAISIAAYLPDKLSKPRFTVDCVVSRTVSQRLTGDGVICVLNGCGRLVNVCFVIRCPCAVDGTLKYKNQLTN